MAAEYPVNNAFVYFRQQLNIVLTSTSKIVRTICLLLIIGYLLSFWRDGIRFFGVTPYYLLPPSFRIWTTFTFCFFEIHIWNVFIDIIVVVLCSKLVEPLWGAMEMINFFVLINFCVAFFSTIIYLICFYLLGHSDYIFKYHIYGLTGYIAAVTVVVKQIIPDIQIIRIPTGSIKNRHLPVIIASISIISYCFGVVSTYPIMILLGILVSWIYLRFYQRHSNGTKGDMSDNFNFASFFPSVMQPVISVFANTIFSFLVQLKMCRKIVKPITNDSTSNFRGNTEWLDNERRRKLALKALSERLNKSNQPLLQPMLPVVKAQASKKSTDDNVIIPMPSGSSNNETSPNELKSSVIIDM